jgi:uncharacterized protein YkwD
MKIASIVVTVGLMAAPPAWSSGQQQLFAAPIAETPAAEKQIAEKQIFDQLNHERKEAGLAELEWNDLVAKAARRHAEALVDNQQLSHQFPGELSLPERIGATGARFTLAAENVARTGYVEDVHLALMNSPGHRANILSSRYNAVGIGLVEHEGRIYVAEDFVFLVPEYSEAQFSAAFSETVNLERKTKRIREIDIRADALLRELACTTDGDAAKLANRVTGIRAMVVFTSSEPHGLPEQMLERATNPDFHRMNLGVCFRPGQEHGYANFWVVATFNAR